MARTGAAAIIIGNEVLTAKVEDVNGPYLVRRMREHGIPLRAIFVVPDEVEAIVGAVVSARAVARWVVTSGGIVGKIVELGEHYVTLEIADNVKVKVQRHTIGQILPKGTIKSL